MMSLSSCSDFLDKTPDTRVYLSTVDQLRELLVTGYMSTSYATTCELSSDNVVDNTAPDANGNRYNLQSYSYADDQLFAFEDVNLATDDDSPSGVWSGCYGAIATANAVLEKAEEFEANGADANGALDASTKAELNAIKGEAYLIRAYHHFILCNVFCLPYRGPELSKEVEGIPYITKPETTVKPKYERGNLATDYDMIEADLLKGLDLVSDEYYTSPKYHFNKAAANAFAARASMTRWCPMPLQPSRATTRRRCARMAGCRPTSTILRISAATSPAPSVPATCCSCPAPALGGAASCRAAATLATARPVVPPFKALAPLGKM